MRISEVDLQCEDIMWFAVDSKGNIFECTSAFTHLASSFHSIHRCYF